MTKTIEQHFTDWESHVFGYGYGTGEEFIIPALRQFLELCARTENGGYHHEKLSAVLTPTVAWLLINILCDADIIEYGTSPRGGWLTSKGQRLKEFVLARTVDELLELTCRTMEDDGHDHCSPDFCNCGPNGYEPNKRCPNPFWTGGDA
jgi:hypothetical protein